MGNAELGGAKTKILTVAYVAHFSMKSDTDFELRIQRGTSGDYRSELVWGTYSQEQRTNYHETTNEISDLYLHEYWLSQTARAWDFSIFLRADGEISHKA